MGSPGGGVGGGSDSSSNDIQSRGMTGSERTQDAEARSGRNFGDDLAEAKAENARNQSPNDDGGGPTAPSTPPDAPAAPENDDQPERAAGPPGIGAPPSTPETDDEPERAAGPPGIGAPPSTPETDDKSERAAGPPGIGAPPPNAEDVGPALTGDLDPGLTPEQSESLAEGAAVMQGSTFAGMVATIGAGMARGFGMGFGGVYAAAGPPSAATPVPHDDAVVAAGATIVGAGAAIYGGYQAYQALTEPQAPEISYSESSQGSSPPFRGEPGESVTVTNPDGTPKQTRTYGEDGYPEKDIDYNHDHGQGQPHVHDWGRPEDGSPPTHKDRGRGRPPKSNEAGN